MQVVFASNNAGKTREVATHLAGLGIELLPQGQFAIESIEETGLSFVENAILKARHASQLAGLPAIADDSGIEVDALQGAPGVQSARYGGPDADDSMNNARLLKALDNTPDSERTARFQCIIVYMRHATDPTPIICQGAWEGLILRQPRGENGFGYDPLFWLPDLQCTAAELDLDQKNRFSHRGHALRKLLTALRSEVS